MTHCQRGGPCLPPGRAERVAAGPLCADWRRRWGFHIILILAVPGDRAAWPTIVLLAEFIGLRRARTRRRCGLARRWSQAMGVLIAVGAVTGTVLSFEMGLLWPGLMRRYGRGAGLFPFAHRGGCSSSLEAIFAGIYLWGWAAAGRLGPLVVWRGRSPPSGHLRGRCRWSR